ncbi:putative zinc-finger-containing protein [Armillaria mellea]|nr:putative zinc-finger-containing protein [Armillaria mellea]
MSTDMIRMDGVYCALCDQYFFDKRQRDEHIMNSNDHPECWRCGRRFLNGQILRRHCVTAPNHHYCVPCDKHCRTAAGFRVHMEQVHGSDDDDSDDDSSEEEDYYDLEDGWEDERGEEEYPDEVSESGDEPLDTSWEDSNEYDFEDPEYLRLPPSFNDAATDDAEGSDEEDVKETSHFSCPMCEKEHTTLCATPCGHVYCVRCIRAALKYTEACPVCDERATEDQLRKIYISQE